MTELVIQKVFMEKGSVDFMLNFEEYGKDSADVSREGDSISQGIMKMLRDSPKCFEPVPLLLFLFITFFTLI